MWHSKAWGLGAEERKSSGLERWQPRILRDEDVHDQRHPGMPT